MEQGLLFHERMIRQRFSNKETVEQKTERSDSIWENG